MSPSAIQTGSSQSHVPSLPPIISHQSNVLGGTGSRRASTSRHATETTIPIGGQSITNVHAQRVIAVLNEAISKLDIIMSLPPVIDRRAYNMFGSDLADELEKYHKLKYMVDNSTSVDHPESDVINELHNTVRNVCRMFLHSPEYSQQLSYYNTFDTDQGINGARHINNHRPKSPELNAIHSQLSQLDNFKQLLVSCKLLTVEKLTRSFEDEESKKIELQRVLEREKKTWDEVENLKSQLEKVKKERHTEINAKNDLIRKYKDELKDTKQMAEEVARRLEMRTKAKDETDQITYTERETGLLNDIKQTQIQLMSLISSHREEELNLRKRRYKVECEVEAWISKYDQDMEEKQAELDDISTIYAEEKSQLNELQAKYDELNQEYQRILDDRKWHQLVKDKLKAERTHRNICATKIQSVWRGYLARKLFKELKEKKKTKSSKGSRKKKK